MADVKVPGGSVDAGGAESVHGDDADGLATKYGDIGCHKFFLEWKRCMCEFCCGV
jgi:hypothetical protein